MEVNQRGPHASISVPIAELGDVDRARRAALQLAQELRFSEQDNDRVALVVTEAATNIVQHAKRGELLLRAVLLETPALLEVLALDQGPGMANVAEALRDGFSPGGSSGLGLGTISRLSTCFDITSTPGKGTAVLARIAPAAAKSAWEPGLEWGVVCVAKRDEELCGDSWAVTPGTAQTTVLVIDGLGHGALAFEAARQVVSAFWEQTRLNPGALLQTIHEAMSKTRTSRGAVVAVAAIDWRRRELRFAGAGNIAGALVPVEGRVSSLVSHSGTVGENVTRFQEFTHSWPDRGLLILSSDGLSGSWDLASYPGLSRKHPSLIAGVLYRDFASRRDDVVVLVGREREPNIPQQDRGAT
jgi:anti-sigma regulatory factor (Ser/Thr protein kinase)